MKTLGNGAVGAGPEAGLRALAGRLGRVTPLAVLLLSPLVFWLGFAENFEVPKFLVVRILALLAWSLAAFRWASQGFLAGNPAGWPVLLLAASAVGSCLASGMRMSSWIGTEGSWQGAATGAAILLGALAAGSWLHDAGMRKAARGVLLAAAVILGYTLIQALRWDPLPWNPRAMGSHWLFATLGNPVHLANYLACAFWLTFAYPFSGTWRNYGSRALLAAAIFLTGQESALLGLALGAGVYLLIGRKRRRAAGLLAAAFALALFLAGASPWGGELMGARWEMWKAAARLVSAAPLAGIGPGLFYDWFPYAADYAYYLAEPPVVKGTAVSVRLPACAHNELLDVAAGQGLLGLGIYVWALLAVWRAAGRPLLLPAAASLWAVHLVNPSCVATSSIFWILLVAAAGKAGGRADPAPAGTGSWSAARAASLIGVAILLAGTFAGLRTSLAQAYRREAGRLAYRGRVGEVRPLMGRWSVYVRRNHPRQAYEDALFLREQWKRAGGEETAGRALKLFEAARAGNRRNIFYAGSQAYFQMEVGRDSGDIELLAASEETLRWLTYAAPGLLCLRDDLAETLAAQGKVREAREMRESREKLDEGGVFRPEGSTP